jgi:hypothetical protein
MIRAVSPARRAGGRSAMPGCRSMPANALGVHDESASRPDDLAVHGQELHYLVCSSGRSWSFNSGFFSTKYRIVQSFGKNITG